MSFMQLAGRSENDRAEGQPVSPALTVRLGDHMERGADGLLLIWWQSGEQRGETGDREGAAARHDLCRDRPASWHARM